MSRPFSAIWTANASSSARSCSTRPVLRHVSRPELLFDTVTGGCDSEARTTGRGLSGGSSPADLIVPPSVTLLTGSPIASSVLSTPRGGWSAHQTSPPRTSLRENACRMPAAEPRYGVAQVTEESLRGWVAFCERNHVDRTALCEVIGLTFATLDRNPPLLERVVRDARQLANERRRRG